MKQRLLDVIKQEGGLNKAAAALGLTGSTLSLLLDNKRSPGPRVIKALGLKIVYVDARRPAAERESPGA